MPERPRRRAWWIWPKVFVSAALLLWLGVRMVQRDGIEALADRLAGIDPAWLCVGIALHFAAVFAGVARWRLLLRAAGIECGPGRLLRSFLVGRFVGAFTPSTTGLDGWRLYDVGREHGAMGKSAAVIVVEKLVGLIGMALVCAALVPFGGVELLGPGALFAAIAMASVAALGLFLIRRPDWLVGCAGMLPRRVRALGKRVAEALGASRLRGPDLARAVSLGVVSHIALSSVSVATAFAIGVDASPATLLVVGNAITLAVLLPVSVGGVGVREGVAVVLLASAGVSSTDAVLVALLGYLTGQVPALLGGGLLLTGTREVPSPA